MCVLFVCVSDWFVCACVWCVVCVCYMHVYTNGFRWSVCVYIRVAWRCVFGTLFGVLIVCTLHPWVKGVSLVCLPVQAGRDKSVCCSEMVTSLQNKLITQLRDPNQYIGTQNISGFLLKS